MAYQDPTLPKNNLSRQSGHAVSGNQATKSTSPSIDQIYRSLSAPFWFLLIFSLSTVSGLMIFVTHNQNETAINRSIHLANSVIERQKKTLAATVLESGYWDQAVDNLVTTLDLEWADGNIGTYANETLGISSTYVLGANNEQIYSSLDGERTKDDPLERFSGGLSLLIDRARSGETTAEPVPLVGLVRDNDMVHFAAVVELTTYFEKDGVEVNQGTDAVLIFTVKIDDKFLREISKNYLLYGSRFVPSEENATSPSLPLVAPDRSELGNMVWDPELPGNEALPILLSTVVIVFILMGGTAYFFMGAAGNVAKETGNLMVAKELAEQSNAYKSRFLTSMSHELRTPLNAVLGFSQLLEMGLTENSREEDRFGLEQIAINGAHLLALIEQILFLAKIEQGKVDVNIQPVEPRDVIQECIRHYE